MGILQQVERKYKIKMKKEEQEQCVKLLRESLVFINFIPNKPYRGGEFLTSYALAAEIDKLFNKLNNNERGKKV